MTTEKEVKSSKKKKVHVPIINRAETHFGSSYTKEADIQKKKKKRAFAFSPSNFASRFTFLNVE